MRIDSKNMSAEDAELSRADFIAACIDALEEMDLGSIGEVAQGSSDPESQSSGSGSSASPGAIQLEQPAKAGVPKIPPPSAVPVLSRIARGDTASIQSREIFDVAAKVAQWIIDFESDHRSVRTFVSKFTEHASDVAVLSDEFLNSFATYAERKPITTQKDTTQILAHLALTLFVKLPQCLLRFEKALLRQNVIGDLFGARREAHISAGKSSIIISNRLREALVNAVSKIPLHIVRHVSQPFWTKQQMTEAVLTLQNIQFDICHQALTSEQDADAALSSSFDSAPHQWVTEFHFLHILREACALRFDGAVCAVV